jgi:hypothetical protein
MVRAKLYVEGAGQTDLERSQCRRAFAAFFESAGLTRRPRTVPCGGRGAAYDAFKHAAKAGKQGELPLLLVDSEAAVAPGHTVWQHLKSRDEWDRPSGASEDQAFLMVQVMETWFLADRDMLRRYFGTDLVEKHLRDWPFLESVPKGDVLGALEKATAGCGKKRYAKGKVSFEMLEKLDATKVEGTCPHAKSLVDRLRKL